MSAKLESDRLAVLVHEVRSPIAALSAIAETLADGEIERDARRELVRLATLACSAVERIVTDAAVASIRAETIDPLPLVRDVVAAARLRGERVELTAPTRVPLVDVDPARIRQALDNLIVNAVVHGTAGGGVSVKLKADSMLRVDVVDSGPGIEPSDLERIFDPGVRLASESSSGAGIGLALARAIAEGHGGALTVVSDLGVGTTFTLSLPLRSS